jgi:hypothetical protein
MKNILVSLSLKMDSSPRWNDGQDYFSFTNTIIHHRLPILTQIY